MRISEIRYVSEIGDVDEENDNIDVFLKLSDGRDTVCCRNTKQCVLVYGK